MPVLPGESDEDAARSVRESEKDDVEDNDEDDEDTESDEEDGDENEYEVEKIVKHGFLDDGTLQLRVKWKGYPMSEATWEPEQNVLIDAGEAVESYYEGIGGKPINGRKETRKKRKADESGQNTRKKNRSEDSHKQSKEWNLPKGLWDDHINSIDAIEESVLPNGEKKIMAFVIWNNGVRSKHPLLQLHDKSPKKMLQYYYDHLSFSQIPDASEDDS